MNEATVPLMSGEENLKPKITVSRYWDREDGTITLKFKSDWFREKKGDELTALVIFWGDLCMKTLGYRFRLKGRRRGPGASCQPIQ